MYPTPGVEPARGRLSLREPPNAVKGTAMAARTPLHPEGPLSLGLAVIESSLAPVILLDADLTVIAASTSFCDAFGPLRRPGWRARPCRRWAAANGALPSFRSC